MWGGIQKLKQTAGSIGSQVKSFTKDMLVVEETGQQQQKQQVDLLNDQQEQDQTIQSLIEKFRSIELPAMMKSIEAQNQLNANVIKQNYFIQTKKDHYALKCQDILNSDIKKYQSKIKLLNKVQIQAIQEISPEQFQEKIVKLTQDIIDLSRRKYGPLVKENKVLKQRLAENNDTQAIQKQLDNIKEEKEYLKNTQIELQLERDKLEGDLRILQQKYDGAQTQIQNLQNAQNSYEAVKEEKEYFRNQQIEVQLERDRIEGDLKVLQQKYELETDVMKQEIQTLNLNLDKQQINKKNNQIDQAKFKQLLIQIADSKHSLSLLKVAMQKEIESASSLSSSQMGQLIEYIKTHYGLLIRQLQKQMHSLKDFNQESNSIILQSLGDNLKQVLQELETYRINSSQFNTISSSNNLIQEELTINLDSKEPENQIVQDLILDIIRRIEIDYQCKIIDAQSQEISQLKELNTGLDLKLSNLIDENMQFKDQNNKFKNKLTSLNANQRKELQSIKENMQLLRENLINVKQISYDYFQKDKFQAFEQEYQKLYSNKVNDYQSQIDNLQSEITKMSSHYQLQIEIINRLKESVKQQSQKVQLLENQNKEYINEINALRTNCPQDRQDQQIQQVTRITNGLEENLHQNDISDINEVQLKYEAQIVELDETYQKLLLDYQESQDCVILLRKQLESQTAITDREHDHLQHLKAEIETINTQNIELQRVIQEKQNTTEGQMEIISNLQDQLQKSEQSIAALQEDIKNLQEQINHQMVTIQESEHQLDTKNNKIHEQNLLLEKNLLEISSVQQELLEVRQQLAHKEQILETLEQQSVNQQNEISSTRQQLQQFEQQYNQLSIQLQQAQSHNEQLINDIKELKEQQVQQTEQVNQLSLQNNTLDQVQGDLKQCNEKLSAQNNVIDEQAKQIEQQQLDLQKAVDTQEELQNQIKSLMSKSEEQAETILQLQKQLEHEDLESQEVVGQLVVLETEIQKLKSDIEQYQSKEQSQNAVIQHLENTIISQNQNIIELNQVNATQFDELKQAKSINQQIQDEQHQSKQAWAEISQILQCENDIDKIQASLLLLQQQLKNGQKQAIENYNQMQAIQQKLQTQNQDLQKREQQLISESQQGAQKLSELIEKTNSLQNNISKLEQNKKEQIKQISELEKQKKELNDELKNKSIEIDTLKKEKANLTDKINQTGSQVSALNSEMQKLIEQNKSIFSKNQEIQTLQKKVQNLEDTLEQMTNGIQNLQLINETQQQKNELMVTEYEEKIKLLKIQKEPVIDHSNELHKTIRKLEEEIVILINSQQQKDQEYQIKLKEQAQNQQNLVDKRIVRDFLLNYFDSKTPHKVRQQILDTLTCVLSMDDPQREKIGLHIQKLNQIELSQKSQQKSLADNLIGFLTQN